MITFFVISMSALVLPLAWVEDEMFPIRGQLVWLWIVCSGVGEAVYALALGKAYELGSLSLVYTATRGLAMMLIWPVTAVVFGTPMPALAPLGTLAMLLGLWMAQHEIKRKNKQTLQALLYSLLSACGIAIYHTGYKGSMKQGAPIVLTLVASMILSTAILLWVLLITQKKQFNKEDLKRYPWGKLAVAGLLAACSFLLALFVLRTAHSGTVLTLRNTSVGFALAFAWASGERLQTMQWVGLGFMLLGILLFSL